MGKFFMFKQVIGIEDQKAKDTSQCEIKRSVRNAKKILTVEFTICWSKFVMKKQIVKYAWDGDDEYLSFSEMNSNRDNFMQLAPLLRFEKKKNGGMLR